MISGASARYVQIYIDGASRGNPGEAAIGVVFLDSQGNSIKQVSRYLGETTNNVAEYMALLYALHEALRDGYTDVAIKTDSELLARQIQGHYKVRDTTLRVLHNLALHFMSGFRVCHVEHVTRNYNVLADRAANNAIEEYHAKQAFLKSVSTLN